MEKGTINVQTENIFPIIKKFLYSDHEIFLRELVSNGVDACQKLKTLSDLGEVTPETEDFMVEILLDKKKKTITIRDNGIGMTEDEIEKYINQIAFSGAEEFVQKYKEEDKKNAIIGHFGLGFYSSFMVAKKVDILSRSQREGTEAVHWSCDGSPDYTMKKAKKETKGTDVVLHIAEDSEEFLDESRITGILNKYCKFLPIPVKFGTNERTVKEKDAEGKEIEGGKEEKVVEDNIINNTSPAWTKSPSDLTQADYDSFYRELYPMNFEDPLFHIHLNVDYPFNLTGILYFPKLKNNFEVQKNKINLYSNQVFITDNVENIVPEFLTLLHGVIDSPDIPLNVSRSYLQEDANVKKISSHITKKVAAKLSEMFKKDRKDFEQKWDDIEIFIHYGMLSDEKFYDKGEKFSLYKTTEGEYFTFDELNEKVKDTHKDKDGKTVLLYTNHLEDQHSYIETAKDRGYTVLQLDNPLVSHLISKLESKHSDIQFARVDADTIDKLIQKEDDLPSKLTEDEQEKLKPVLEKVASKEKFDIQFSSMSENDAPILITQSEFMRRMKEQQMAGGGGMQMFGQLPEKYNLVVNSNHKLAQKMLSEKDADKKESMAKQAVDLALLAQGLLKGKALTDFVKREVEQISK